MPNGGSDCCGTCWFNKKNKGEAGYGHANSTDPDFCQIRNTPIKNPFYTYCANHPHHNHEKLEMPIGPIYTGDSMGARKIWLDSPDNEEIRELLLSLLSEVTETPQNEYPAGQRELVVIEQLLAFREKRALDHLRRIAKFDAGLRDRFGFPRAVVVHLAQKAIRELEQI